MQPQDTRPLEPLRCAVCLQVRPFTAFRWRRALGRYDQRCIACRYSKGRRWQRDFTRYASMARRRDHTFTLTYEEFAAVVTQPCAYCGEELPMPGLDRVDNRRGYEPDNIVPCCTYCNRMKWTMGADLFLERVRKIARHWGLV